MPHANKSYPKLPPGILPVQNFFFIFWTKYVNCWNNLKPYSFWYHGKRLLRRLVQYKTHRANLWISLSLYSTVVLELIAFPKGLQNVLTLWTKIMPFPQVASHGPHALQGLQSRVVHNYKRIKDLALLSLLWFESKQIKFNIQRGRYLATMYFLAGLYLAT